MPIRTPVIFILVLFNAISAFGIQYSLVNNTFPAGAINYVHIDPNAFSGADFTLQESQQTTSEKNKTTDSAIPAADVKKEKGFFKKLFTKATKAEKVAKKEAKNLSNIEDQQTRVYGWHPYWMKNTQADYNYNLLTTLSYYSLEASYVPDKNRITYTDHNINGLEAKKLFNRASQAGCRIDVTFKSQDANVIDSILNNPPSQEATIHYLLEILNSNYQFDGICIAFESIPPSNAASLLAFMSNLKMALKGSNRTLKIALPAKDYFNNYDILNLNKVVDEYILMAYNYHHKGSSEGPVCPLYDDKRNLHLKGSVTEYLSKGIPYHKLIVALPFYGIVWVKDKKKDKYVFSKHLTYAQVKHQLARTKAEIKFDKVSYTYYYEYEEKSKMYRCYFDNEKSLVKKYKWLIDQHIAGVGIWALGYDKGSDEFWNMIEKNVKVKKLPSLQKKIIVKKKTQEDTVYIYHLIDSIIQHTSLKNDTIFIDSLLSELLSGHHQDTSTTAAPKEKSIIMLQLRKLAGIFKPLLSERAIAATIVLTLIAFGLIGLLASLLFSPVRELLYVNNLPTYLFINVSLILLGLALFGFLGLLKADIIDYSIEVFNNIKNGIWTTLLLCWVAINLFSYKLLGVISLKYDKP